MKKINSYISEKLKLNKDTKINNGVDEINDEILSILSINNDNESSKIIYDWLFDNSINTINDIFVNILWTINLSNHTIDSKILNGEVLQIDKFTKKINSLFGEKINWKGLELYTSVKDKIEIYGNKKGLYISSRDMVIILENKKSE